MKKYLDQIEINRTNYQLYSEFQYRTMSQKDNSHPMQSGAHPNASLAHNETFDDSELAQKMKQMQSPPKVLKFDKHIQERGVNTPNQNGFTQSKEIIIQSVDPVDRFDSIDFDGNNSQMNNSSLIPRPSGFQQLQALREQNASSFNDTVRDNSKSYIEQSRNESIGADTRGSPPKTMIGSGIGQGFGFQRGFTMRHTQQSDPSHKHTHSGGGVPVSQINLNSNPPSLVPQLLQSVPENSLRRQSTQAPHLQQSLSQRRVKNTSPKNQEMSSKLKSSTRSKSFKKHAMFSSVASANLNQNQITDDQNLEFSTQRKTREEIDKVYKSLNKGDDSDDGARTNSMSRGSSYSNENGNTTGVNGLFENQQNQQDNVKVCIRVRPLNHKEQQSAQGRAKCVQVEQGTVYLERGFDTKKFNFDFVGNEQIDQSTIFNHIAKPIADSCMQGYNGTIFAYGQTGAGKTFTIQGPVLEVEANEHEQCNLAPSRGAKSKEHEGIIQRSFNYIFQNIQAQQQLVQENADGSELNYLIKCSYLEIYNEQIMDLLEPSSINLSVREDIKKGVYVEGLKEEIISSYRDMLQLTLRGFQNRHVGSTAMNRESSRSHSVLTTIIESKSLSKTGVWNMKTSRFHIIDLAGSERSKNTNAIGERLKEAGMINKSLSALGNVINSLVERSEGKGRHIPYRDSKLTFILRDSLGGNSKTVIIANVSPSTANMGETLSTLEFAKRAKQIKNKAVVNEDSSGTILILKNEIKRLKKDLTEFSKKNQKLLELNHELSEQKPQKESAHLTCKNCRMSIVMEEADQDLQEDGLDDSMLIDDMNHDNNEQEFAKQNSGAAESEAASVRMSKELRMSKEFKIGASEQYKKMKMTLDQQIEKTKQAENLLALNLQNLTAQQRYFESELQSLQEQHAAQTTAFEALTQQQNRDKMKLKLREDKISKLEAEHSIIMSEECLNLQQELKMLQEQLDREREESTNPKVSALKAQLVEVQLNLRKIQKDTPAAPPNLPTLFSDQKQMIDQLSEYLNSKGSIEAIEQQEKKLQKLNKENEDIQANFSSQQEQLNDLQKQYDILLEQNVKAEEVNQRITREYGKANVEIRHLKEKNSIANRDLKDVKQTKNDLESQFQIELQSKEELIQSLQSKFDEQASSQQNLQSIIDQNKDESSKQQEALASQVESSQNEAKSLKEQLEEKLKIMVENQMALNLKQKTIEQNVNEINSLKDAYNVLDQSSKQQKDELNQQNQTLKEAYNALDNESKQQKDELHQKNQTLKQAYDTLDHQSKQQQDELDQKNQTLKQAYDTLDQQTKQQKDELQEQIKSLQIQDDQKQEEIKLNIILANDLKKQVESLTENIQQMESENGNLKNNLKTSVDDKQRMTQNLNNELTDVKQQMQTIQIELDNSKEQNSQLLEDHQQLLNDHESVMKDQQQLLSQYENLKIEKQTMVDKHSSDSNAHLTRQQELNQQVAKANAEVVVLTKALQDKDSEMHQVKEDFKQQFEQSQHEHNQNIKQMQIVQQQTMTTQIKQMEDKISELKEQTQKTVQDKESEIESLQKIDQSQKEEIGKLKDEITSLNTHAQQVKNENESINIHLNEKEKLVNEQNSQISEIQKEKDWLSVEYKRVTDQIIEYEKKHEDLESQNKAYQSNISYLDVSVEQMQTTLQQKASDYDRLSQENHSLQTKLGESKSEYDQLNEELIAVRELLKEKCEVTQGQDQENAETQVLLLEAHDLIQKKESTIVELSQNLETSQIELTDLRSKYQEQSELFEEKSKQSELATLEHEEKVRELEIDLDAQKKTLQKLEVEKDNLQFKRDEATKNLEQKIKDLKQVNEDLVAEAAKNDQSTSELKLQNSDLQEQIKAAKIEADAQKESQMNELTQKLQNESGQALAQVCQEKENISQQLVESQNKESKLLQEVTEMQNYIDNMTEQLNKQKQYALEVDLIKQDCYKRIASIQEKQVACFQHNTENLDQQKQKIKDCVAQALAEIADVSQYNSQDNGANERQIEVSLLVSQIVCEFSKLYENQIVIEKKKASQDYKKYSDKCEKQKNEIKLLNEEKSKVNQLIVKGKEKDAETKQLKEQIERLKYEFEAQIAEKMKNQAKDLQNNTDQEHLGQKIKDLEKEKESNMQKIDGQTGEINELNENIKQYQKQIYEQKQLYEVRVQSQEQEIEQHQFRYRELERKVQADIQKQEGKFAQVQEQVHILAQSTKQAQADKEALLRQIQEMQGSVEQVQFNDEKQRDQLNKFQQSNQLLQKQVQQRESEMAEVVQSLKQFAEANRQLEAQLNVLRTENEQLAGGHRNPNQKIQFHMKIKEENNRLRADNFRLQEDLQRKIETIYKQQQNLQLFESTTRTLKGAVTTTSDPKADSKVQRDFNSLVQHITTCPQFAKIARANGVKIDQSTAGNSIHQIMELITAADDALEQPHTLPSEIYTSPDNQQSNSQTRQNIVKGVPPRHINQNNILGQSKSSQNLAPSSSTQVQPNSYGRTANMSSMNHARGNSQQKNVPLASSSKKKLTSSGGTRKGSEFGRDSKLDGHQTQYVNQKAAKQSSHVSSQPAASANMQGNSSQRQVLQQQQMNSYVHQNGSADHTQVNQKSKRNTSTGNQQQEQSSIVQGSPVIINSYSSLYKQAQQQQMAHIVNPSQQQYPKEHLRVQPPNSPFIVQQPNMGFEGSEKHSNGQMHQNQQYQQQMAPEQQYQQQQIVPNSNYSALNSKHKQYKQAQSQKSTHLGSQRSKSRQGAAPSLLNSQHQEASQSQKTMNQNYQGQYSGGYIE